MICLLHGYLLEGSGSNLWTRSVIESLCRQGETVHLMCQENHPEIYAFIGAVYHYPPDGTVETKLERDTPHPGRCFMHKPYIGATLPVYVWDRYEEFDDVLPMIQLSDAQIDAYLDYNVRALGRIVETYRIHAIHANHAVLMSVVAQKIHAKYGIPYAVMPHGSALEYTVKKDARFFEMASRALDKAQRIFVIGREIRGRVKTMFDALDGVEAKMTDLNLGVDTRLFRPIAKTERAQSINALKQSLADTPRGKSAQLTARLEQALFDAITLEALLKAMRAGADYPLKNTDKDVETSLAAVNWNQDPVILFVGRLISGKGIHLIAAALPFIFQKHPRAKLVIVGHGPLREALEAFLFALGNGLRTLAQNMVQWGAALESAQAAPFRAIRLYWDQLEAHGRLDAYFEAAQTHIRKERIIFTGYLKHSELRYLFPCCDAAVFPSVVAEAGPLVFLEAMASGCFPMGAYFAGMAASIDSVKDALPNQVWRLMQLRPDENHIVADIAANIQAALKIDEDAKAPLRKIAKEKYDWEKVSRRLADCLDPNKN